MSSALRKLTANASKCNCTIIFLNQLRMKIGVIYGNPEITSGGNALKFYSSVRVDVRRKQQIEGPKGDGIGVKVKAKVRWCNADAIQFACGKLQHRRTTIPCSRLCTMHPCWQAC